jgi:hypothetical protein
MLSVHAASIRASCVRTEYPSQSGAQDIPKRSPRIKGPDSENNVDRLRAKTASSRRPEFFDAPLPNLFSWRKQVWLLKKEEREKRLPLEHVPWLRMFFFAEDYPWSASPPCSPSLGSL